MAAVKLAFASDLHLPITKDEPIAALGRAVAAFAPQAFVVAGDIGESLADLKRGLQLLREQVRCPIWMLAGNHDVWARPPHDSRRLWMEQIPATANATGCEWLEGTSFVLDGVAVAGTIAWYDYSAADPSVQASRLEFAQQKFHYNADALRIDWELAISFVCFGPTLDLAGELRRGHDAGTGNKTGNEMGRFVARHAKKARKIA